MSNKTFHSCCGAPAGKCPGCAEGSCLQEKKSGDYREGPDSTVTHDGQDYLVDDLLKSVAGQEPKQLAVKDLEWVLKHDTPNPSRVAEADYSHPLIVMEDSEGRPTVVDGLHRLAKAKQENVEHLPTKTAMASDLTPTRVRVVMPHGKGYLMERMNNKKYPATLGRIRLPGGGIDPGETARQAAIREMAEELSLKLKEKNLKSMGIYPDGSYGAEEYFQYDGEHGAAPGNYIANFGGDKEIELVEGQTNDPNYWGSQLDALQQKEPMDKQAQNPSGFRLGLNDKDLAGFDFIGSDMSIPRTGKYLDGAMNASVWDYLKNPIKNLATGGAYARENDMNRVYDKHFRPSNVKGPKTSHRSNSIRRAIAPMENNPMGGYSTPSQSVLTQYPRKQSSMDKQSSVGRAAGLLAGGTAAGVKALTAPKGYKKEEAGKAFHRVSDATTSGMLGGALGLLGGVGLHDVLDRSGVYGGLSSKPGWGQLVARLATLGLPPLAGAYLFGKGSYNRAKAFHGLTTREKQKRRADFEKELASQGFDEEEVAELTDHDDAELFGDTQSDLKTIQMDKQSVDNLLQWMDKTVLGEAIAKQSTEEMDKQAVNRGLGSLPQGDGPQQMQYALQALSQARRAVDPTETLKRKKLKRKAFDQNIRTFAASNNPTYRFGDYKKDKKVEAVKSGLLGALLGGGLGALGGYLTGRPGYFGAAGAAAGAGIGGLTGFQRAAIHNDNLMRTAKTLKEYGLNQPSYLQEALPLLVDKSAKEDKPRHDACYHSVKRKYKVFPSAYASGAIAKCRKAGGPKKSKTSKVRKSQSGADLKRWFKEDWVNTRTGGDCGDGKGKGTPYCRPKKRVSSKTPKTKGEMSKSQLDKKKAEKNKVGLGDKVKPVQRKQSILAASQRLVSKESVIGPKPKPRMGGPIKKMVPGKPGPGRGGMMGPKPAKLSLQLPNNYTEAKQALYAAEAKMSQFDTLAAARQLRGLK